MFASVSLFHYPKASKYNEIHLHYSRYTNRRTGIL